MQYSLIFYDGWSTGMWVLRYKSCRNSPIHNMVDELVIFYIYNLNFFLLYSQASANQVFGWSNFAVTAFDITILVNSHPF